MSIIKTIKTQLGISSTPTQNFTLDASAADGTMKLARGNAGATTQDVFTVDASGRVAFPNTPVFLHNSNSTSISIPNDTYVVFTSWNASAIDTLSAFNVSTGKFQPTVSGYYQVNARVSYGASSIASSYIGAFIYKNNIGYWDSGLSTVGGGYPMLAISSVVYLNGSSDYVTIATRQISGTTATPVVAAVQAYLLAKA